MKTNIIHTLLALLIASSGAMAGDAGQAGMKLAFPEKDSARQVMVTITKTGDDGKEVPVKGVDVKVFVKRTFSLLPVEGDNLSTNEEGVATVDFPKDIPGDSLGNLTVVAKVEDSDKAEDMESSQVVKWGVPLAPDQSMNRRALWASAANAPLPLVIFVTSMVGLVWGVIFYIVSLLFKIKKLGNV